VTESDARSIHERNRGRCRAGIRRAIALRFASARMPVRVKGISGSKSRCHSTTGERVVTLQSDVTLPMLVNTRERSRLGALGKRRLPGAASPKRSVDERPTEAGRPAGALADGAPERELPPTRLPTLPGETIAYQGLRRSAGSSRSIKGGQNVAAVTHQL
jgi:hypothetical protein